MFAVIRATLPFAALIALCTAAFAQEPEPLILTLPLVHTGASVDVGGLQPIADTTSPDGTIRQVQFAGAASGLQLILMLTTKPPAATVAAGMDSLEKQIRDQLGPKAEISRDTVGPAATMSAFTPEVNGVPLGMGAWSALARENNTWLLVQLVKVPYAKGEATPFADIVRSLQFFRIADTPVK